jgi:hypothetical protein
MKISPDPVESREGEPVTIHVSIDGRMDLAGNATTPNGGAEIDWGDGKSDPIPMNLAQQGYTHVYLTAGQYYPSARIFQDYKYDGNGSCSYRCDLRRAAVVTVFPALKAPYMYTTKLKDSLSSIASKFDGSNWKSIYLANRTQISSPDFIEPGQTLLVAANFSNDQNSFRKVIAGAWARIRGGIASELMRPEKPGEDLKPLEPVLNEPATQFGEFIIDRETDLLIEGARNSVEKQVAEMLSNGSRGVVIRIGIYTAGYTRTVDAQVWGEGDTPLIAIADGLRPSVAADYPGMSLDDEESFFSFYTKDGGRVSYVDLSKGFLIGGDADKIREQADKQREALRIGAEIARQLKSAKSKKTLEEFLRVQATQAQATAAERQMMDEGPMGGSHSGAQPGHAGASQRPGPDGHEGKSNGIPREEKGGQPASGGGSPASGATKGAGGLPSIPIGGDHPGQPAHGGNDGAGNGIPIGGEKPKPNGPENGAKPDGTCCTSPQ